MVIIVVPMMEPDSRKIHRGIEYKERYKERYVPSTTKPDAYAYASLHYL